MGHRGSAAARFSGSFHRQTDLVFRTVVRATWRLTAAAVRARRGGGMFLARQTYYSLIDRYTVVDAYRNPIRPKPFPNPRLSQ